MKGNYVPLESLMVRRGGSVDPSKFKDEEFDLYSIPAFDRGGSELVFGRDIGSSKQVLETGDVLLSKIVPHIRRAWVVGASRQRRIIGSGEWIVFRAAKSANPRYLSHVLVGDPFHSQFMQTVSGVGGSLLRARPAEVAKIQIPLPPLAEQKRIAAILDAADALRAKRREALAQLNALLQSTFLTLFGDPVANPMGWPTASFDDCIQDLTSSAIKIPKSDFQLGGQWQIIDQSQNEIAGYSDIGPPFTQALPAVVFGDHTRCVKLVRQPFLLGADGAKLLVPRKQMLSVFLSYLLPLLKLPDLGYSRHMREVKRLVYPLPPLPLQQKFAAIVESIERQKTTQRAHLAELDALFAALQHRAFRGEL